jgi:hypothetical protein
MSRAIIPPRPALGVGAMLRRFPPIVGAGSAVAAEASERKGGIRLPPRLGRAI